jgi:hypothetical protein
MLSNESIYSKIDWRIFLAASVVEKVGLPDGQGTATKNRQIVVEIPENIDISPAIIFRYLGEKLANMSGDQNEVSPPNYLIRPKQTTMSLLNMTDVYGSRHMTSPLDHSRSSSGSSSEVRFWDNVGYNMISISILNRFPKLIRVF